MVRFRDTSFLRGLLIGLLVLVFISINRIQAQQRIGGPYESDSATVLLLHFDENFENASPRSGDAQVYGNLSFVELQGAGDFNKSLRLDNDSPEDGSHLRIPDTAALDLQGNWTMEVWVNNFGGYVGTYWNDLPWLLMKPAIADTNDPPEELTTNYSMRALRTDRTFESGYHFEGDSTKAEVNSDKNLIDIGEWFHVTFIRDTSREVIVQLIHQNANEPGHLPDANNDPLELVDSKFYYYGNDHSDTDPLTSNLPVYIGGFPRPDSAFGFLDGFIDEVRISDVVRDFSIPPVIKNVTDLENQGSQGDYKVQAEIQSIGDEQLQSTDLHYRLDEGNWQSKAMMEEALHMYSAAIPSQEVGTTVDYYVSAETESGLRSTRPEQSEQDSTFFTFGVWRDHTEVLTLDFDGLEDGEVPRDRSMYQTDVQFHGITPKYVGGDEGGTDSAMVFNAADSTWLEVSSPFYDLTNFSLEISFYVTDSLPAEQTWLLANGSSSDFYELARSSYQVSLDSGGVLRPAFYSPENTLDPCGDITDECLMFGTENDPAIQTGTWYKLQTGIRDTLGPKGMESSPGTIFALLWNLESGEMVGERIHRVDAGATGSTNILKFGGVGDASIAPYFNGYIDDIKVYNYMPDCVELPCPLSADQPDEMPDKITLGENYPNPFNPKTKIEFELPNAMNVQLRIYDVLGRKVATLVDGKRKAGSHTIEFNAGNLSSGVYIYKLQTPSYSQSRKMLLLK